MYTLDYDSHVVFGPGGQTGEGDVAETASDHDIAAQRNPAEAENEHPLADETDDAAAEDAVTKSPADDKCDEVNNAAIDELRLHCQVYALAEKYAIKALMIVSRDKFQKALEQVDVSTRLFEVVDEIYTSTPDSDRGLRDVVVSKAYSEIQYWLRQTECHQALVGTSSFCVDLLKKTVCEDRKRYEQAIADVQHPGYCESCDATFVVKRTTSKRKNVQLEKYCAKCDPWH